MHFTMRGSVKVSQGKEKLDPLSSSWCISRMGEERHTGRIGEDKTVFLVGLGL